MAQSSCRPTRTFPSLAWRAPDWTAAGAAAVDGRRRPLFALCPPVRGAAVRGTPFSLCPHPDDPPPPSTHSRSGNACTRLDCGFRPRPSIPILTVPTTVHCCRPSIGTHVYHQTKMSPFLYVTVSVSPDSNQGRAEGVGGWVGERSMGAFSPAGSCGALDPAPHPPWEPCVPQPEERKQ